MAKGTPFPWGTVAKVAGGVAAGIALDRLVLRPSVPALPNGVRPSGAIAATNQPTVVQLMDGSTETVGSIPPAMQQLTGIPLADITRTLLANKRRAPLVRRPPPKLGHTAGGRIGDFLDHVCDNDAEVIWSIASEIHVSFELSLQDALRWPCDSDDGRYGLFASVINTFAAMRALTFTQALPPAIFGFGFNNLFNWYKAQNVHLFIRDNRRHPDWNSGAWDHRMDLLATVFMRGDSDIFLEGEGAIMRGVALNIGLVVHETRHAAVNSDHDCHNGHGDDSSYAHSGAWAAEYDYYRYLAAHSDPWTTKQQQAAAASVLPLLAGRFCDGRAPSLRAGWR